MKKTGLLILLSCGMICGCSKGYIEMDILSSNNTTSGNWYELDIDVIADKDDISDKEACSREIIQHILDNDFHSTRFSFDINGYPNNVSVDVFTSEKNAQKGKEAYSFEYVTEFNTENPDVQNNIKDNPGEFEVQYE